MAIFRQMDRLMSTFIGNPWEWVRELLARVKKYGRENMEQLEVLYEKWYSTNQPRCLEQNTFTATSIFYFFIFLVISLLPPVDYRGLQNYVLHLKISIQFFPLNDWKRSKVRIWLKFDKKLKLEILFNFSPNKIPISYNDYTCTSIMCSKVQTFFKTHHSEFWHLYLPIDILIWLWLITREFLAGFRQETLIY